VGLQVLVCIQQARALLSIIITPLLCHLSPSQNNDILTSIDDAKSILSRPLKILNELLALWKIQNLELVLNWRSFPICGSDSYCFGRSFLPGFRIEDVLSPLPYPFEPASRNSSVDTTARPMAGTMARSRKEALSFVPSSKPVRADHYASEPFHSTYNKPTYIVLPPQRAVSFASSDSSSIQTWASPDDSSKKELLETLPFDSDDYSCCTNQTLCLIHGQGHPSDREHTSRFPSRRKIMRCMRSRFKSLLTSL
jgi:hypothetical protein